MFGIGGFEFFLILVFGFLIVGPDRLPAMAKTLGEAINKFRGAQEEMSKVIKTEVYDPNSKDPFKDPLTMLENAGSSKGTSGVSEKTQAKPAAKTTASGERRESFSERKARYEKERAAKKAEDAKHDAEQQRAAAKGQPAKAAPSAGAESDAEPVTGEKGE